MGNSLASPSGGKSNQQAVQLKDGGGAKQSTSQIAQLLDQHQSGERDHSAALWSLSMFEAFLRQVHGSGAHAAGAETVGSVV